MRLTVIGGTGLVGSKLVDWLTRHGHRAIAASPSSGVNTITGEGVSGALANADVVVDVTNPPSFADREVLDFFTTSTRNLLKAEHAEGVGHHVALSVVGTRHLGESGYFRAKIAQEDLITESTIPFSIVHATQFFEFIAGIADAATEDDTVRIPPVSIQPIAADDVASAVGNVASGPPINGIVEAAGPELFRLDELVRWSLRERNDPRQVITDPLAPYFGARLGQSTLIPGPDAVLADTRFADWLDESGRRDGG